MVPVEDYDEATRASRLKKVKEVVTSVPDKLKPGKYPNSPPRRIPMPARGVHPSWIKRDATEQDEATCVERARDRVLGLLAQPLLSAWTLIQILHLLLVVGFGALFFFLLLDRNLDNFGLSRRANGFYQNIGIQALNGLFTWSSFLTLPWRLSNATHLTCSRRSCAAGRDFYGKPTDGIWFNIPPFHRRLITLMLLTGSFSQFTTQAFRIVYYSYELSNTYPGSLLCNVTFGLAMGFSMLGALYQLLQERVLRRNEPERFPPGPLEDVALSYRGWRRGLWTIIPRPAPSLERVRSKAIAEQSAPPAPAPAPAGAIARSLNVLAELPWLLENMVTGSREPPNPTAGPSLTIVRAGLAPPGAIKRYVTVSVSRDGGYKYDFVARTPAAEGANPEWNAVLRLGEDAPQWGSKAKLKLLFLEETTLRLGGAVQAQASTFIGLVILQLSELSGGEHCPRGGYELLLEDTDGNPVLSGTPLQPCLVTCMFGTAADVETPPAGPAPSRPPGFPHHAFMMTRGTRGDVQPFVALARGLCSELGWLVTICTEARWKSWVLAQCADITGGEVRFLPSGGDSQRQTESVISKEIMGSKTEALQQMMLAASEANFFSSAPVFMHHLKRLQEGAEPKVGLIINSFTTTAVALLCGEAHGIPVAGFCLQPTCIPSDDKDWHAIIPIDSWGASLIDEAEKRLFTSHASLKPLRQVFLNWPFHNLSIPSLRAQFGLEPSLHWKAVFKWQLPQVIPMLPDAFKRPTDWPPSLECTDFIFLRSSAPGGGRLATEQAAFIETSRAKGRKLMVMTFSSMPVPRSACLAAAVEMLTKSKHDFALMYVGKRQSDPVPAAIAAQAAKLAGEGKLLEAERADFGVLFREMDAFVVHGGLGTTVEALRMRKPTAVTGILLMDQRFWGFVCHEKGVGPKPVHIEAFKDIATDWADRALDPQSDYATAAAALSFGDEANDGVSANVAAFDLLIKSAELSVPKSHKAKRLSEHSDGDGSSRRTGSLVALGHPLVHLRAQTKPSSDAIRSTSSDSDVVPAIAEQEAAPAVPSMVEASGTGSRNKKQYYPHSA